VNDILGLKKSLLHCPRLELLEESDLVLVLFYSSRSPWITVDEMKSLFLVYRASKQASLTSSWKSTLLLLVFFGELRSPVFSKLELRSFGFDLLHLVVAQLEGLLWYVWISYQRLSCNKEKSYGNEWPNLKNRKSFVEAFSLARGCYSYVALLQSPLKENLFVYRSLIEPLLCQYN